MKNYLNYSGLRTKVADPTLINLVRVLRIGHTFQKDMLSRVRQVWAAKSLQYSSSFVSASVKMDRSFINLVINKRFVKTRLDGKSLAGYWVGLTGLEPLSPNIRTDVYFLTRLDTKCVTKHKYWLGSSPFPGLFWCLNWTPVMYRFM